MTHLPETPTTPRLTRKLVTLVAATALSTTVLVAPVAAVVTQRFTDVPADGTHAEAIAWLDSTGLTAGCDTDEFCPADTVTREQLASFLYRLSGNDPDVPAAVNAATVGGLEAADLQGQTGPRGATGPAGAAGADSDVPGPAGPPGAQGLEGPTGTEGPAGTDGTDGVSGYTLVTSSLSLTGRTADEPQGASVSCPAGQVVLGGGAQISQTPYATINYGYPRAAFDGDFGTVPAEYIINYTPLQLGVDANGTISIYATCADVTP